MILEQKLLQIFSPLSFVDQYIKDSDSSFQLSIRNSTSLWKWSLCDT